MISPFVDSLCGVTLAGGGPFSGAALSKARALAPCLVGADGGADRLLALDAVPDAVMGDLDSLSPKARLLLGDKVHHIPEQDSTDFDKALRYICAPFILGLGFMGARVDHALAAYSGLLRASHQICILIGPRDLVFLAPPLMRLDIRRGTRFSLFPMGSVRGESQGLRWPIAGINFAPDGMIGTSNEVSGPVTLRFDARKMLVILPVSQLDLVLQSFARGQ
jgi:thiamine pyrophosphokinase